MSLRFEYQFIESMEELRAIKNRRLFLMSWHCLFCGQPEAWMRVSEKHDLYEAK